MGQRKTPKAGLAKFRIPDPQVRMVMDSVVERLEVLDGIRGDTLDKAVTYRDLADSGFTVVPGAGGTQQVITNTPGAGTGNIQPGPAGKPSLLATAETFLALLLTWTNPGENLQHIEVWRGTVDNLSLATMIGTTVSPQFADYVGANATYYYWVRAVGTDGTYSAYNATAGTTGTTGIDPSAITMPGSGFIIQDPGVGPDITPFIVGTVNGVTAVGLSGQLIVDGTIRAESIVAESIGADRIATMQLSAISADLGTVTAGLLQTAAQTVDGWRVEIQDQASTPYPIWYGKGPKAHENAKFYVDQNGNVVVKGLLDAGMIKQSYFAPATTNLNSFRIATEYPNNYPNGEYLGKAAHLMPMRGTSQATAFYLTGPTTYISPTVRFYGPAYTGSEEYGRLGTDEELLMLSLGVTATKYGREYGPWDNSEAAPQYYVPQIAEANVHLEYLYSDGSSWSHLTILPIKSAGSGSVAFQIAISTRSTVFDWISFRYRVEPVRWRPFYIGTWKTATAFSDWVLENSSLMITTANFGYADATLALLSPTEVDDTPLTVEQLEARAGDGFVQLP